MHIILKVDDIILNKIKFSKAFSTGDNSYNISIEYLDTKKHDLIIQTPIMVMPFGLSKFGNNKYLDVSFYNTDDDDEINNFYQLINDINGKVNKYIKYLPRSNKIKKYLNKESPYLSYYNNLKPKNGIFPERLRLLYSNTCKIFGKDYRPLDESSLKTRHMVKLLIQPACIWINKDKYGISWIAQQAKLYNKLEIPEYQFIDSAEEIRLFHPNNPNNPNNPNLNFSSDYNYNNNSNIPPPPPPPVPTTKVINPIYQKYFKMKSMGIPTPAIKQKIILDKLNPDVIDNPSLAYDTVQNKLLQEHIVDNPIMNKGNLLLEIKKGKQLKNHKARKLKPLLNKIKKNSIHPVPSLFEIRKQLKIIMQNKDKTKS